MSPTPWETDRPELAPVIIESSRAVLTAIAAEAAMRSAPTVALAKGWHRRLFEDIPRPHDYYAGEIRDTDPRFPDLIDYEVKLGLLRGVPSAQVPGELERFQERMQGAVARIDPDIAVGAQPRSSGQLQSVMVLCAIAHGEWVRIHPFANGNGRTARLWANWVALRYGLPPFVTVKPRPRHPYGSASMASMRGDHTVMTGVMLQMLREYLDGLAQT